MKFAELQKLLNEKLDIDHLADIARELDVSPQAVSNWKSRDRVPYKYVVDIRKKLDNLNIKGTNKEKNIISGNIQNVDQNNHSKYIDDNTISLSDLINLTQFIRRFESFNFASGNPVFIFS